MLSPMKKDLLSVTRLLRYLNGSNGLEHFRSKTFEDNIVVYIIQFLLSILANYQTLSLATQLLSDPFWYPSWWRSNHYTSKFSVKLNIFLWKYLFNLPDVQNLEWQFWLISNKHFDYRVDCISVKVHDHTPSHANEWQGSFGNSSS